MKSPAEWLLSRSLRVVVDTFTTRPSSRNGSGRSRMPLTTLKMAVLAAMPSAIVATAISTNPGDLINVRIA